MRVLIFAPMNKPLPDLMTPVEAAAYLRVHRRTLETYDIPAIRLSPRTLRYRRSDIEKLLAEGRGRRSYARPGPGGGAHRGRKP